jgi:hypothetical protein
MDVGLILGIAALVAAFLVPGGIEALKRPRLEITPSPWSPVGPVAWTFAAVRVCNKPLPSPFTRILVRQAAQGCVVEIDYFKWGTDERVFSTVSGRWSSHQQPIRSIPSPPGDPFIPAVYTGGTASLNMEPGFSAVYDRTLDPRQHDVAVSKDGEEVAVAILRAGEAFAFSTESYDYNAWGNPAWRLDHGTYRIVVRVRGSGLLHEQAFKLEYLSDDFTKFRLQSA